MSSAVTLFIFLHYTYACLSFCPTAFYNSACEVIGLRSEAIYKLHRFLPSSPQSPGEMNAEGKREYIVFSILGCGTESETTKILD
jgi:hypothetical protein